jgi:hypothetical protein
MFFGGFLFYFILFSKGFQFLHVVFRGLRFFLLSFQAKFSFYSCFFFKFDFRVFIN